MFSLERGVAPRQDKLKGGEELGHHDIDALEVLAQ